MTQTEEQFVWLHLKGYLGHFRRPMPNTTKQTYDIPPRTTIEGLLAAGLGVESDEYYELFDPDITNIGVEVLNNISKRTLNKNYKTITEENIVDKKVPNDTDISLISPEKHAEMPYQQEVIEYVRQPEYIIYISTDNEELFDNLKEIAINKKWVYTPYFGSNECSVSHLEGGVINGELIKGNDAEVTTIVPETAVESINSLQNIKRDKFVTNFTTDETGRVPTGYTVYYYTQQADETINITSEEIYNLENDKNIVVY